jgi:raffinose/stachyose/melibiose transport system permease protein
VVRVSRAARVPERVGAARYYTAWFLVPGGAVFLVLFLLPAALSFIFAFTNWNFYQAGILDVKFVGLRNFLDILRTTSLNVAFKNTFLFAALTTLLKSIFGLALALLVSVKLKTAGYLRVIFFFPCILSSVAVGLIFLAVYNSTSGLLNRFLSFVGLSFLRRDWLGNLSLVMYSVSMAEVWKWTGYNMIIFLAGLSGIPGELSEAAGMDGCTGWQRLRFVTLPLLRPAVNMSVILGIISGLKVFDIIYVITGGGPGFASDTFNSVVYKRFAEGFYGLSTAEGVVLFVTIVIFAVPLSAYLSRREVAV